MDANLRNAISSCFHIEVAEKWGNPSHLVENSESIKFINRIWVDFLKNASDERPSQLRKLATQLKWYVNDKPWYLVYDLVESIVIAVEEVFGARAGERIIQGFNNSLQRERSGYRFIGKQLVPITNDEETKEIEDALSKAASEPRLSVVGTHLSKSLRLYSDRQAPDYANSIKEAISAVESLAKIITGNSGATLGDAIGKVGTKIGIHRALVDGIKKIYGYTSDEAGIRHGAATGATTDFEDARFMVLFCSSLINYLLVKSEKAGVALS